MEKANVHITEVFARNLPDQLKRVIDNDYLVVDPQFNESKSELTFTAFDGKPIQDRFRRTQLLMVLTAMFAVRNVRVEYIELPD